MCGWVCACHVTTTNVHTFINTVHTITNDDQVYTCNICLHTAIYHHVSFFLISFSFSPVHSMQLTSPSAIS